MLNGEILKAEGHLSGLTVTFQRDYCDETCPSPSFSVWRHALLDIMEKHRCLSFWFLDVTQPFLTPASLTKEFVYSKQVSLIPQNEPAL